MTQKSKKIDSKFYEECLVVRLSTTDKSNIVHNSLNNSLYFFKEKVENKGVNVCNQHLYILSDDLIKKGDWGYNTNNLQIIQTTNENQGIWNELYKIIATTDQSLEIKTGEIVADRYAKLSKLPSLPDAFLKNYCETQGEIDKVLIEYEELLSLSTSASYLEMDQYRLKVTPDNTITVKSTQNSYTRKELIDKVKEAVIAYEKSGIDFWKQYPDWIEQWIFENV